MLKRGRQTLLVLWASSVELLGICPMRVRITDLEKRIHLTTHPLFKALCGACTLWNVVFKMAHRLSCVWLIPSGGSGVWAGHR